MAVGRYKKKECPSCKKEHTQRGEFCSKTCSNLGRPPEVYEKVSEWMRGSEKGQEITYNLTQNPDFDPPLVGGISKPQDSFVSGGDLWTSDKDW
jgi:hypothetical protein